MHDGRSVSMEPFERRPKLALHLVRRHRPAYARDAEAPHVREPFGEQLRRRGIKKQHCVRAALGESLHRVGGAGKVVTVEA